MSNTSNNSRKNKIYGNWLVLHPDGFEMFRCTAKKANWYLKRELSEIISDVPPVMQLNFRPNGPGCRGDGFSLHQKTNECVVCGITDLEKLTRHHIVPSMYKKFFPEGLKIASSHDVVCICRDHHDDYEIQYATLLKERISELYNIPLNNAVEIGLSRAIKLSKAYVFNDKIPESRLEDLILEISICLEKDDLVTSEELIEIANRTYVGFHDDNCHGKLIVDKIDDFQGFVEMWRKDFIESMKPKFMPSLWSVKRLIKKDLTYYDSVVCK